jgi:hypothetical protein
MRLGTPSGVAIILAIVSNLFFGHAKASIVSYDLQLNNLSMYSGQTLARVTLTDIDVGVVAFTVEALIPGSTLQKFGFNFLNDIAPSGFTVGNLSIGWNASVDANKEPGFSGFGKFDVSIKTNGNSNRLSTLGFSVIGGSAIDYVALSSGNAGIEQSLFAAHVTNLNMTGVTGYAGGGTAAVPIPPAVWLFSTGMTGMMVIARRKRVC